MLAPPSRLHSSGLNSILFAINIDNSDLNGGVTRGGGPSVSNLLKESTQGIGSLWKESTQGVSSLLREISTATAVVPGFTPRVDGASDPLPVLPRSTSAGRKWQDWIGQTIIHNTVWPCRKYKIALCFCWNRVVLFGSQFSSAHVMAKNVFKTDLLSFSLVFLPLECGIINHNPPWQIIKFERA